MGSTDGLTGSDQHADYENGMLRVLLAVSHKSSAKEHFNPESMMDQVV